MGVLTTLGILVVGGAVSFGRMVYKAFRSKRPPDLWDEVARDLGGERDDERYLFRRRGRDALVLDVVVDREGTSEAITISRCWTTIPLVGFEMSVSRSGRALFGQDVSLGHAPEFDRKFVVKTTSPAIARRLWSPAACEIMLREFRDGSVDLRDGQLTVLEPGRWSKDTSIRGALALVDELRGRDVFGVWALRKVRGGRFSWLSSGLPATHLGLAARVSITVEEVEGELRTIATTEESSPLGVLSLTVDAQGQAVPSDVVGKLSQGALLQLPRVGAGLLMVREDSIRFRWPGVEEDAKRLRAAADLLSALVTGGQLGIYR